MLPYCLVRVTNVRGRSTTAAITVAGILFLSSGCTKSPYELAPVHGAVTVDGKPLTKGKVMFAPVAKDGANPGKPAFGWLGPDGRFELTTYHDGDGAIVGDHWVTIFGPGKVSSAADDSEPIIPRELRFERFTVRQGTFNVTPGKVNDVQISITNESLARYAAYPD
jgi:hypothetical protein